jgi:hypothetical protein
MAMMAMTTSNSMRVKARLGRTCFGLVFMTTDSEGSLFSGFRDIFEN